MKPELRSKYEVVIGIECHVQLATKTKLFCGCDNDSRDALPNTHVCPVCLALPGTLPVLNEAAVQLAIRTGHALHATYPNKYHTKFDRKNYFYPDLPKGYQITQFDEPVVPGGYVEFPLQGEIKRVGITRAHLEEDAGKLMHPVGADYSLVDLNRAGTPLLEIVSEPDMRSPQEARAYAEELWNIVRYAKVSDANLYYGNMRFDVNVSVRPVGQVEYGTRSETKNMNSFRAVERAVEYELRRQIVLIENGENVKQETRGWNDDKLETYSMRSKEDADEYRYFPEPDVPPLILTPAMIEAGAQSVGLTPNDLRLALEKAGMPTAESAVLVAEPDAALMWYDVITENPLEARFVLNWLIGERVKLEQTKSQTLAESQISSLPLAAVGAMVREGKLSSSNAKILLERLWDVDHGAQATADEMGLLQQSDETELAAVVDEVIAAHSQAVNDYKSGNTKAFAALVGQTMKATKGKGNPPIINKLLHERLDV